MIGKIVKNVFGIAEAVIDYRAEKKGKKKAKKAQKVMNKIKSIFNGKEI